MDSKTWELLENLFFEALDRPPAERGDFLDTACAEDSRLRAEIDAMLAAHEDGADSGLRIERTLLNEGRVPAFDDPHAAHEGQRVGAWRLERLLGRGGMGEVWLATRADGEFEQRAAVKLVRSGWRAAELAGRFRRERQLLARLAHPHIATLLDGGVTATGAPFLAMEFVDGEPITAWCAARALSLRDRLALFRVVCEAVRFAHANLVVHRDLKPANILVTNDGRPILLDFGIAKLLDPEDADAAATRSDDRLLTPEHAAPEQLRGDPATIATDVWALGALLFEMLTGRRPFDVAGKSASAIERLVCEGDPPRPSSVVEDAPVARALRGDLDAIVLGAMRREPERRYRSVEQLAEDVDRYLDGLPVRVQPDTFGYRTRKFVRRHRAAVAAASAFVLLVLAFAGFAWRQSDVVARERDRAVAANEESQQAIAMLVNLFSVANPRVTPGGDTLRVDEMLRLMTGKIAESKESPRVRAKLWSTLAEIHVARTRLAEAESALVRGAQAAEEGDLAEERLLLNHQIARLVLFRDGRAAARPLFLESARAHEAHFGPDHQEMVPVLIDLAGTLEDCDAASVHLDRALESALRHPDNPTMIASVYNAQGANYWSAGRLSSARDAFAKSYATLAETLGADHIDLLAVRSNLAVCESGLGRFEEAENIHRRVLESRRAAFGDSSYYVGASWMNVGVALAEQGRFRESVEALERAEAISGIGAGKDHVEVLLMRRNRATALARAGNPEEGFALYGDVISKFIDRFGEDSFEVLELRTGLAKTELFLGRRVAVSALRDAANRLRGTDRRMQYADVLQTLGLSLLATPDSARPGEVEAVLTEAIERRGELSAPEHPVNAFLRVSLALARSGAGKPVDAESFAADLAASETWGLADPPVLDRARALLADVRSGR